MSYAGTLEVLVVEGKNIKNKEMFSKQDPYVKLMMDMETVVSKTHHNGGKNPTWNQTLFLNIIPGQNILKLECWDNDLASDDFIGGAVVNLDQILKTGSQDLWVDLRSRSGSHAGQIRLVIYFRSKTVQVPQQFNGQTPYATNGQPMPMAQPTGYPMPAQVPMQPPMQNYTYGSAPMPAPVPQYQQGYPQPGMPNMAPGMPMQPYQSGMPMQQPYGQPGMPMQQPGMPMQQPYGYPPNQGYPAMPNYSGYPGAR
jgi:hypothetical protein